MFTSFLLTEVPNAAILLCWTVCGEKPSILLACRNSNNILYRNFEAFIILLVAGLNVVGDCRMWANFNSILVWICSSLLSPAWRKARNQSEIWWDDAMLMRRKKSFWCQSLVASASTKPIFYPCFFLSLLSEIRLVWKLVTEWTIFWLVPDFFMSCFAVLPYPPGTSCERVHVQVVIK